MHPVSSLKPLFWEADKKCGLLQPRERTASRQRTNKMSERIFGLQLHRHDRANFNLCLIKCWKKNVKSVGMGVILEVWFLPHFLYRSIFVALNL